MKVFLFVSKGSQRHDVNANGKLDRKALPDPVLPDRQIPYEAPSYEAELKLCTAFEKVIGIEAGGVGRNDDFFAS